MQLYTAAQMQAMDRHAIENLNIPSTLLMENAAKAVAQAAAQSAGNKRAALFCGSGNNGGDGIAAARHLIYRGFEVRAMLVSGRDKLSEDSAEMERRLREAGGALLDFLPDDEEQAQFIASCGVLIDAMFGTGLHSPLRGSALKAAERINSLEIPVVSADIPSGISADTGEVLGYAVAADVTVTFAGKKRGHCVEPGNIYSGRVVVVDIGIPLSIDDPKVCSVEHADMKNRLPCRNRVSHKGDYGKILVIGGCVGYTGAPYLAAQAALKSGAGLISIGVPESIYPIIASKCVETMPFPLPCADNGTLSREAIPVIMNRLSDCDLCLLGPGLGRSEALTQLVCTILRNAAVPVVLDADGINAISGNIDVLDTVACPVVLTPHTGEYQRLGGVLSGDRLGSVSEFSDRHKCVTVLKGHRSITAFPGGRVYVNTTGNPGMAKGGSGDVLSGIVAALICQMQLQDAVPSAVWLHGRAGDLAAARYGETSMTPSDIIDALSEAFKEIG
jgi:NAD(P)H-hydrate epimerase